VTTVIIPELPFSLDQDGSPPCQHVVEGGALTLKAAAGTDMFIDPSGAEAAPGTGRLVGEPPVGDFTLTARTAVTFANTFDAGVLLVYADDLHWAKLCFELSPQRIPMAVTVVTKHTSDDCNSFEVSGHELWLRITRIGQAWAFHASTDGQWWRLLRYFTLSDSAGDPLGGGQPGQARVGFLAQSPTGPGCTVTFDHIALRAGAPADLRDGS
jgi:regulation of enolase protein 1 (concanavalin A-like superfamily)